MALVTVRPMAPADFPAVAEVDRAAFSLAAVRSGREPIALPRHVAGLEYFRSMAPDLCHIALVDGEIAGYTIGHRWGSVAWIGPIGTAPAHMSQGIGTALLEAFYNACLAGGASTIGLETSVLGNVQLYERRGYQPVSLRLLLAKPVTLATAGQPAGPVDEPRPAIIPLAELEPGERVRLADESLQLAGMVHPGLDHRAELAAVPESGMGESLVALSPDGHLLGYAALWHWELRAAEMDIRQAAPDAVIWLMAGWPSACRELVLACERRAAVAGLTKLKVPCYGASPHGFALLRSMGYHPEAAFVRMLRAGSYPGSGNRRWGTVPLGFTAWLG